jgi:hypothetical protein
MFDIWTKTFPLSASPELYLYMINKIPLQILLELLMECTKENSDQGSILSGLRRSLTGCQTRGHGTMHMAYIFYDKR